MIDVASATGRKGDVCFSSVDYAEYFDGKNKACYFEPPDMICPECMGTGDNPRPGGFWTKSCLAKTTEKEGACRHKGCAEGNRQRAKVGLPPIDKGQYAKAGDWEAAGRTGLIHCDTCGNPCYAARHKTTCASCVAAKQLATETDPAARRQLQKTINRLKSARARNAAKRAQKEGAA